MKKSQRFAPVGMCAIAPAAFGAFFDFDAAPANIVRDDGTAIVSVAGPLMHHEDWCCDSYDAIKARVAEALAAHPQALVLAIDSPGGLVDGCFDTATELRAMCAAANVPLYAFVDGVAYSAAYGLACAAQHIAIPSTGMAGSIGVINALVDARAQDAMFGVQLELVASGARKTDGNPHAAITDGARAAMRSDVMTLAEMFFAHVSAARPALSVDAVRGMEAGLVIGAAAVSAGLADQVATLDELLAQIATGTVPAITATEEQPMKPDAKNITPQPVASKAYEDAIAALRKCAQGDDEDAKKAKRMLQAELADDAPPASDEPDGDEPKENAQAEGPPVPPKKEDEDAKALKADVAALKAGEAARQAQAVALERASLIASRPDFSAEHAATLAKATTPIELVREQVASIPRGIVRKPAAAAAVTGTRGEGQGDGTAARQMPEAASAMARAMGLESQSHTGVVDAGNVLTLGATMPKKAS